MAIIIEGERIVVEKTYAQMAALIAAEELNPFLWYKITDRGDNGLVFRAASPTRLESTGLRYMLCPATYKSTRMVEEVETLGFIDAYDNEWIGVWNADKQSVATTGQLCIWNGLVWVAGAVLSGDSPDTELSGWTVILKASFTNNEYIEMIFNVCYDFDDDWISKQWDNNDNIWGLPFIYASQMMEFLGITENIVNLCDWNYVSTGKIFFGNHNYFCYNNSITGDLYLNNASFIFGNEINGSIYANYGFANIVNNKSLNNAPVNIMRNTNNGSITGVWDADVTDPIVDKTGTAE